jgi:HAD superfamily hydrolase (TIGR01509 family)
LPKRIFKLMSKVKNIIFDLGGVLIDIDYNLTRDAFINLGFVDFDKMYSQFSADELFAKLETGKISDEQFYEALQAKSGQAISSDQIRHAWNAMLLQFREPSLRHLEKLAGQYQLFLLSNTNHIHWMAFNRLFKEKIGKDSLDDYFIKAWYSHKIGYRKPNADIFEFVQADGRIRANETLFIDDSANNIESAAKMGFKTKLLLGGESIENLDMSQF